MVELFRNVIKFVKIFNKLNIKLLYFKLISRNICEIKYFFYNNCSLNYLVIFQSLNCLHIIIFIKLLLILKISNYIKEITKLS